MKAMVKGIKSNGEKFDYIVDYIINVVYSNENIVLVLNKISWASGYTGNS